MSRKKAQPKNRDRVIELLQESIKIRTERNEGYKEPVFGGAYKQHGTVVAALFPSGVSLEGQEDMGRYAVFDIIVGKLIRYANNFDAGGHDDSLKDISNYAAMLRELDEIAARK